MDLYKFMETAESYIKQKDTRGAELSIALCDHELDSIIERLHGIKHSLSATKKEKPNNIKYDVYNMAREDSVLTTPSYKDPISEQTIFKDTQYNGETPIQRSDPSSIDLGSPPKSKGRTDINELIPQKADLNDLASMMAATKHNLSLLKEGAKWQDISEADLGELQRKLNPGGGKPISVEDVNYKKVINKVEKSFKIIRRDKEEGQIHYVQIYEEPKVYMIKEFLSNYECQLILDAFSGPNSHSTDPKTILSDRIEKTEQFFRTGHTTGAEVDFEKAIRFVFARLSPFIPPITERMKNHVLVRVLNVKLFRDDGQDISNCIDLTTVPEDMPSDIKEVYDQRKYEVRLVLDAQGTYRMDYYNLGFQANCETGLLVNLLDCKDSADQIQMNAYVNTGKQILHPSLTLLSLYI